MKTKTKFTEEQHNRLKAIMQEEDDVKRWKAFGEFLKETNPKARREMTKQARAMAAIRKEGVYNDKKVKGEAGLKFGVSIPSTLWNGLVALDYTSFGVSQLATPDKQNFKTKTATNEIVKKLSRAFPEYKAS